MKNKTLPVILIIGLTPFILKAQTNLTAITTGDIANVYQTTMGASFVDYNNDGYLDIYVPTNLDIVGMVNIPNILYKNNQDGTFSKITNHETINLPTACFAGAKWCDVDNNRLIDLFIPETNTLNPKLLIKQGNDSVFRSFTDFGVGIPTNVRDAGFIDFNNDGYVDLVICGPDDITFYSNNGDGNFTETQDFHGVYQEGSSLSIADVDEDGNPDVFMIGFGKERNKLFLNNHGTFVENDTSIIVRDSAQSICSAWGDYNNDGHMDLFVANDGKNFLIENLGKGVFKKITSGSIVNDDEYSTSCNWADVDNDGDLDLFVGNSKGFYINNGDGTFNKVTTGDLFNANSTTGGDGTWGDYDKDGDLDLYVAGANSDGLDVLYNNTTHGKNWIELKLEGYISNYSAIGAKVNIKANNKWQYRVISTNTCRYGENALIAHFGLDTANTIDSVIIEWPSGVSQYMSNVSPNQIITVQEASFNINNIVCTPDTLLIKALAYMPDSSDWLVSGGDILYNGNDSVLVAFNTNDSIARITLISYGDVFTTKEIQLKKIPDVSFSLNTNKLCGSDTVLVSYTGTSSSGDTYNWNFSGGNIISGAGQGDYRINWPTPGQKIVSLSVEENGCTSDISSQSINVYQPNSSFSLDNVVCEHQNTNISFNGIASDSASFNWDFDGANIISGSKAGPYVVNWDSLGNKNVSLMINDNGCYSTQTKTIAHNSIPTPTFIAPARVCYNRIADIEYTGTASGSANYNWNFDGGTVASGTGAGPYDITWNSSGSKTISLFVEENGCSSDTSVNLTVNQQTQPISICMVGVDRSNHNMIVWDQPYDNDYDSIIIYKQTSQSDVYEKIGSRSAHDSSFYIDENSNPAQNSSRYKIAALDTCGYETPQSDYHKTMHLTINSGIGGAWNLIWDGYEGFSYSTYKIYRGTSDNNMLKIAEQASNTFTFTDLVPPVGTVYYQIEVVNPNHCDVSNYKSANDYFGSTWSNVVNSGQVSSTNELSSDGIKIYPNPADDKLFIQSPEGLDYYDVSILSLDGKLLIDKQNLHAIAEIDISNLKSGMYMLRLNSDKKIINTRFIKR